MGRKAEALTAIRQAIDLNPSNKKQLRINKSFETLSKDPEFIAIVGSN